MDEREKQHLGISTFEEQDNSAVMIYPVASKTVASVEKSESYSIETSTASGTTYSSAAGKQAEDSVDVGQRYIRVVDEHGTRVGPSCKCAGDSIKASY